MNKFVSLITKHTLLQFALLFVCYTNVYSQCDSILFLGNDTLLCEGEFLLLDANLNCADAYEWQDGSTGALFIASDSGSYNCSVTLLDSNLVSNGDFSLGNTLFSTSYSLGTGGPWGTLSDAETYAITTNPNLAHDNFSSCGDHTTGTGNMMVVNGSTVNNLTVWSQDLEVEPNTDYQMEVWLISCVSDNPGSLKFSVDGVNIGPSFTSGSTTCSWQQFTEEWNSGTSTSITFSIKSQGGAAGGNDYALDDISFSAVNHISDTILVDFQDLFVLDLGADTSLCEGEVLTLDAAIEGASYYWNDASSFSFYNVIQEGNYWVNVNQGVCQYSDSIYVDYAHIPDNFLGNDSNLCVSDSIYLSIDIDNASYMWQDSSTSNEFLITEEGVYWLEVQVENCIERDSILIDDSLLSGINLGADTSLCEGEVLQLHAGNLGASFLWQDQSTDSVYLVEEEGLYSVQVQSGSCFLYGEIYVDYYEPPIIDLGNDTSLCEGNSLVLDVALTDLNYLWQDNSQDSFFLVQEEGLYWLQVVDNYCAYLASDSITITMDPIPFLDLGIDTTLCLGTEFIIGSDFVGAEFEWQDASFGPLYTAIDDGLYWLIIENQCGVASDSIELNFINCECPFYMPNSFTPNGDSDNDYFPPIYECNFLEFYFVIYDRWGSIVFETKDPYEQWDGKINGQEAAQGVYPFRYQFLNFLEYREKAGFVTLLR